jgi:hypothetical protein
MELIVVATEDAPEGLSGEVSSLDGVPRLQNRGTRNPAPECAWISTTGDPVVPDRAHATMASRSSSSLMLFEGAVLQGPHPQRPIVPGPRVGFANRVFHNPVLRHQNSIATIQRWRIDRLTRLLVPRWWSQTPTRTVHLQPSKPFLTTFWPALSLNSRALTRPRRYGNCAPTPRSDCSRHRRLCRG